MGVEVDHGRVLFGFYSGPLTRMYPWDRDRQAAAQNAAKRTGSKPWLRPGRLGARLSKPIGESRLARRSRGHSGTPRSLR